MDSKFIKQLTDDAQVINVCRSRLKKVLTECENELTLNGVVCVDMESVKDAVRITDEWLARVQGNGQSEN